MPKIMGGRGLDGPNQIENYPQARLKNLLASGPKLFGI